MTTIQDRMFKCCFQFALSQDVLINQLLDLNRDIFLERTYLTSHSLFRLSYPNGSLCLVLKPCISFFTIQREGLGTSLNNFLLQYWVACVREQTHAMHTNLISWFCSEVDNGDLRSHSRQAYEHRLYTYQRKN